MQRSAGGVVFRQEPGDGLRFLLILDRYRRWTLPKGHLEPGERDEEAALREIEEETGIRGRIVARLPEASYAFADGQGALVRKRVAYFLVEAVEGAIRPQWEEVNDARWFRWEEIADLPQYANNRPILEAARGLLLKEG